MTLREKILKTFVVTIKEINAYGGPEKFFAKYPVGGVYYANVEPKNGENPMTENYERGTGMSRAKLKRVREAALAAGVNMLVCADGASLVDQKVRASQASLGAIEDESYAYDYGKIIGMQMNAHNIDWVLGPIIDMYFSSSMPLAAVTDDPIKTAKIHRQIVRGIQDQGVCATVKHFPGLGTYHVNMHFAPGQNVLPFDEWMKTYGFTYKEMFDEGVMAVMNTHVALKSYANEKENGFYPSATFSSKLTQGLLKNELKFGGAVVTDAMIMGGNATGNLVEECVQAFKAGADFILWPPMELADRLEELILSGEVPMSRLDDALSRIDKMFEFRKKALENHSCDEPDVNFVNEKSAEINKRGICLLRNEMNILPLKKDDINKLLIIDATSKTALDGADTGSADLLKAEIEKRGIKADVKRAIFDVESLVCWQDEISAEEEGYDYVLFNLNSTFACSWDDPFMLIWASHMLSQNKKIIINYGSPFFAVDFFPEDKTIIEVNCGPTEITVSDVVSRLFGEEEFTGVPVIDASKWDIKNV